VTVKDFENPLTFGENVNNKKVGRFGTQCIDNTISTSCSTLFVV